MNVVGVKAFSAVPQFREQNAVSKTNKYSNNVYLAGASVAALGAISVLAYCGYSNSYKVQLAKDLSKELGEKITTKNLKSIMSRKELLKELPKLTEQNYIASTNNLKNGVFLADLHSHSNFSDGQITVENLLNQAAEYGDKLEKINGKKFIFALTDHDGIDGVKDALKIIAKNPEKYKNIKFVPASEISFVLPCDKNSVRFAKFKSDVQMPEMLVYGINPFSKTSENFFNRIYNSRERQILKAINDANSYYNTNDFSAKEYNKFFHVPNKKYCFLNQHWRVWNYIHTKSRITQMAAEQNKDSRVMYETIANELRANKKYMTPYELNEYIKQQNIQTRTEILDDKLAPILKKNIFPHNNNKTIDTEYELQLKDIVNYSKKENAVLAFAHPGFTIQNFAQNQQLEEIKKLLEIGKGQIKLAEKFHQAYPIGKEITETELKQYNKIVDELNLINIGGRDNHTKKFIP